MSTPWRTGFDPGAQDLDLPVSELVMPQVGRRHALRNIVADNTPQSLARHVARLIFDIKPQVRLPL